MLQLLLARLGEALSAPMTRAAAAAYTGSFLARAAFVPPALVVSAVQVLKPMSCSSIFDVETVWHRNCFPAAYVLSSHM